MAAVTQFAPATKVHSGIFIDVKQTEQGVYEIKQLNYDSALPPSKWIDARIPFTWQLGPIKIVGWVDPTQEELSANLTLGSINIGTLYGSFTTGIIFKIDLVIESGEVKLYFKNGNELWVHLALKGMLGDWEGDYEIISW